MATQSRARRSAAAAAVAAVGLALAADGATAVELSLSAVVNATAAGSFLFVKADAAELAEMVEAGNVETNATVPAPDGYIATRATEKGAASMNTATETQTAKPTATASAVFFVTEDEMPKRAGNSGRSEKYEFATMPEPTKGEDGKMRFASFFVAGKKAADMSSTISGANQRYAVEAKNEDGSPKLRTTRPSKSNPEGRAVPVLELTREFKVRDYVHNGVAGALVTRIK